MGGTEIIRVDVRVIAATNRELEKAVDNKRFREDLYYRLNVIPIFIPSLRERKEDIPLLIEHFMKKFTTENNRQYLKFSDEALERCMRYEWPGNVRELENAIENAVVLVEGNTILSQDLPFTIYIKDNLSTDQNFLATEDNYRNKMEFAERMIIKDAIKKAGGNKSRAAKSLKISFSSHLGQSHRWTDSFEKLFSLLVTLRCWNNSSE